MKAIERSFTGIINGTTQFVIPVFQRDYRWTEAQCQQLWNDIVHISTNPTRHHFLGSVVYISTGDSTAGFTRWLLIDGQQRVTTMTLLFIALRDHIKASQWAGSEHGPTEKRVDAYFVKNVQETGDRAYKLVLRRRDNATLRSLVDGKPAPKDASDRILDCYEFFREQLRTSDPELVYSGIGRLIVVDVTLNQGVDDPQLVFESLNSTGIDLSQSDLIRNFILMRLSERDQTRLYEEYWSPVEQLFRDSERAFDAFIRDYIALRTRASKQEKAEDIYFAFRRVFGDIGRDVEAVEALLQELFKHAGYYASFAVGGDPSMPLSAAFRHLRRLVDVPAILMMRLHQCHAQGTLSEVDFIAAVRLVDSYVFRRAICGEQTRGYWQTFANLAYAVNDSQPLQSLTVALARLHDSYRFPSDREFQQALETRDMYGKRVCFDLLDRLERFNNAESPDTSQYTIEHIMPQNERLAPEWREMLGPGWREIQLTWLHRLGNLTLTGYNSTYSDRPFDDKKTIEGGFDYSSIRLNKFVRQQTNWTPTEMEKRGRLLAVQALEIWPALTVDGGLVEQAKVRDIQERALKTDVTRVPMSEHARMLFNSLRTRILEIDPSIIEIAESDSVSYHDPTFFLEVLPRKRHLTLLLALDYNEVDDPNGVAEDASEFKFFINASYQGGVHVRIGETEDIERALPLVRQAQAKPG